jgi:hypothetical protein
MADQTAQSGDNEFRAGPCRWSSAQVLADWYTGGAKAIADALNAYSNEVTADNILQLGLGNGFYEGLLAGFASFADGLAKTTRQLADDTREVTARRAERSTAKAPPAIDYERLAQLVAAEMQKAPKKTT